MGELKSSHEAAKLELQSKHVEELQSVKQQYETSLEGEEIILQSYFYVQIVLYIQYVFTS